MVAKNIIDGVLALPAEDRLDLVRRLWDSIREDAVHLPLTDDQKQELDRRYDEFLEDPTEGSTWAEVEAFVQAKLRA
jgi:putative addiction module component (TIGR02574 family)